MTIKGALHVQVVSRKCELRRENFMMDSSATFNDVVNRIARDLPSGWTLRIDLERDAGTVGLDSPSGEEVEFPSNYECLLDQVNDALEHAIELEND